MLCCELEHKKWVVVVQFSQIFKTIIRKGYSVDLVKGTNVRQKTYEIFHVYSIFYSAFMCQTTVIFGITKDGSPILNTLAS